MFASTDVDDLFVLIAFFAAPRFRAGSVVIGQFLGMSTLIGASVIASLVALVLSPAYVGLAPSPS